MSYPFSFQVHYEPGPATLTHFPLIAVKKKSVTFSCSVDDPGYPETNRFVQDSHINNNHTYQTNSQKTSTTLSKSSLKLAHSSLTPTIPSSISSSSAKILPQIYFHTIQALTATEIEEAYEALIGEHFQNQQQPLKQVQIHDHYQHPNHHQQQYFSKNKRNHQHHSHLHNHHQQNRHNHEMNDNDSKYREHVVNDDNADLVDDGLGLGWSQQQHNNNIAEHKENPIHVKPKHVLKETHALIDLTNNSLCTLLTFTTFSPQTQILTLLIQTPTTGTGNKNIPNHTSISMSSSTSSPSSPSSSSPSTTLSFYRKMGKFSFNAQTIMPTPRYRWLRGGRGPLQDIVTKDWTVEPVGLDSRTNYSCYAFNEGGKGVMATVNLEVHAPPFFIKNLPPYTGMLHTSRNANLTCRIECVPRCEISWLKDGVPIEKNDTRYFVKDKYMDASPATGDFESMLSVLVSKRMSLFFTLSFSRDGNVPF